MGPRWETPDKHVNFQNPKTPLFWLSLSRGAVSSTAVEIAKVLQMQHDPSFRTDADLHHSVFTFPLLANEAACW